MILSQLDEIYNTYNTANELFAIILNSMRDENAIKEIEEKISINDKAYYILIFAQFEEYIDQEYFETRGNPKDPLLTFMNKVEEVISDQEDQNQIAEFRKVRNSIVHGRNPKTTPQISIIVEFIKNLL